MEFLATQISLFMILAAVLGLFTGWTLRHSIAEKLGRPPIQNGQLRLEQHLPKSQTAGKISGSQDSYQLARNGFHPLSSIKTINHSVLEQLKSESLNITTTQSLLDACQTKSQRQLLARKLASDESIISQWACIADLIRIPEIDFITASLLQETAIRSIQDLAERDTVSLTAQLTATHIRHRCKGAFPSAKAVSQWINSASKLQPTLVFA
ncbi:MAG: DUF4332 domain-containing protein [Methylococcales bacterium]|nr:DUF4332 domain-containing protein [Methylococcales bacterium]